MSVKLELFSYPLIQAFVLDAQKNRLIETVLLSTHNICFCLEIKKIVFQFALLSGGLENVLTLSAITKLFREQTKLSQFRDIDFFQNIKLKI